jgi:hypothetical protein
MGIKLERLWFWPNTQGDNLRRWRQAWLVVLGQRTMRAVIVMATASALEVDFPWQVRGGGSGRCVGPTNPSGGAIFGGDSA